MMKRTGGRSAAVLAAIRHAAESLIAENGRDAVTIPAVAQRAGVTPSTIYRRWGDLGAMLNDLATYRLDPDRVLPNTGKLRSDLEAWAAEIVEHYSDPTRAAMLRAGVPLAGDAESNCLRNRRVEAQQLLKRAAEFAGEAEGAPSEEQIIDHVVAPIIYRVIFQPSSLSPELGRRLVRELYRG